MPAPASKRACEPRSSAHRSATCELAVAVGVDPSDRRGVVAAVERLELGDRLARRVGGRAADRGRGMEIEREVERARAVTDLAADSRGEVRDRGVADRLGLAGDDLVAVAREARHDRVDHDAVLGPLFRRRVERGDRGCVVVGACTACDRAGHGARLDEFAAPPHEELRARAHEPPVGCAAGTEYEASGLRRVQAGEHLERCQRGVGIDGDLARKHHLRHFVTVDARGDRGHGRVPRGEVLAGLDRETPRHAGPGRWPAHRCAVDLGDTRAITIDSQHPRRDGQQRLGRSVEGERAACDRSELGVAVDGDRLQHLGRVRGGHAHGNARGDDGAVAVDPAKAVVAQRSQRVGHAVGPVDRARARDQLHRRVGGHRRVAVTSCAAPRPSRW